MKTLNVNSIYTSIDGEVSVFGQGRISTFVRLAQCNLKCQWCDTTYAQHKNSGIDITVEEIVKEVVARNVHKVTITGGEPLLQDNVFELTKQLYQECVDVTIETNGTIEPFGYEVSSYIVDFKLPSSGMHEQMNPDAFTKLRVCDFIKFVIDDITDYEIAVKTAKGFRDLALMAQFAFSPVFRDNNYCISPQELMERLRKDRLGNSYINVQLHKLLNLK
jgi:7-carboxy-7-deazaguanine synthase